MTEEMKKKAQELEQTLEMQLSIVKKESGDWFKVGGAVLIGGLVSYALVRMVQKKKNRKTIKVLKALEKEGLLDDEIKNKLTHSRRAGFLSRFGPLLLPIVLAYGKEILMNSLEKSKLDEIDEATEN